MGEEMIAMIIVGFLLLGAAATVSGLLIADNLSTGPIFTPQLLGHSLPSLNAVGVFCAGLGLALLFCLGVWMIAAAVIDRHRGVRFDEPVDDFLPGQWRTP
jgi:hypothetical protein